MTTQTATANLSALFADFCRANGVAVDPTTFKFQAPEYAVALPTEPIATTEPKRNADEVFGPEIVVAPKKARAKAAPKTPSIYRELQAQCKELGIKANGSTAVLQSRLELHEQGILAASDYAKVKAAPRVKTAKVKENYCGLSYRQTQRLVSWFKANMPSSILPAQLAKNIGWDNVKSNASACLTANGWAAKLNDKQVQMMCDYAGIIDGNQLVQFLDESGLA